MGEKKKKKSYENIHVLILVCSRTAYLVETKNFLLKVL